MASTTVEPRARRTHARRSCDVCKLRKTRCELPDLDIPSSPDPLPEDKSCHRCRVLALPCIVDDSRMKKRMKRPDARGATSGSGSRATGSAPPQRPGSGRGSLPKSGDSDSSKRPRTSGSTGGQSSHSGRHRVNAVDHSVDYSPAFPLKLSATTTPPTWSPSAAAAERARTVRLHGRPLSLVGAMLNVASRKTCEGVRHHAVVVDDVDLEQVIEPSMRGKLEPGYVKLRTLHPHLQPLGELLNVFRDDRDDESVQLLLAVAVYIATQALADDPDAQKLRDGLHPIVYRTQHLVLAHQPVSFHAIQALELLTVHAPFAPALPFQITDARKLAPARGLVGIALSISNALNFSTFVNSSVGRISPDFWLWLGIHASEAQLALEDERPRKPHSLAEARAAINPIIAPENDALWKTAASSDDPAELVGRLVVCDRLARLDELHDAIARLRNIMDTAASMANFNAIQAVLEELEYAQRQMAGLDERHDKILSIIAPPEHLLSSWQAYRPIRRRWEAMKQYMMAFQTLVALHYLPGSMVAIAGLPQPPNAAHAVHYALNRSNMPDDILYAYATSSVASEEIRRCARIRGELAEQQLISFAEMSHTILPMGGAAAVIPIHEVLAITVESAKALMEQQASKLVFLRSILALPNSIALPPWVPFLRRAGNIMRSLALLRLNNGTDGESVANGCSNLIGSMLRTVQEWSTTQESPISATSITAPSPIHTRSGAHPNQILAGSLSSTPDTMAPPNTVGSVSGAFQYMPTSDRWMAGDEQGDNRSVHHGSAGFGPVSVHSTAYVPRVTPTPGRPSPSPSPSVGSGGHAVHTQHHQAHPQHSLDHILSEMFGYGYATMSTPALPPAAYAQHAQVQSHPQAPQVHIPQNPNVLSAHHPQSAPSGLHAGDSQIIQHPSLPNNQYMPSQQERSTTL